MMGNERYIATMDLFPQEDRDHNKLYRFYENLRDNKLTTTKCRECGTVKWPPRSVCPECMSENLEWIEIGPTGKIEIFTVEEVGVPEGFEKPLIHALVALDGYPLTIFSRIVDAAPDKLTEGMRVGLKIIEIPRDRVTFAFKPL
jgi:uncharacterized OB-fold protein